MAGVGLNGSLLMGSQSLTTQRLAIETIGNNLANINTPGYVRQRATIVPSLTLDLGAGEQGLGSTVSDIQSIRSTLMDSLVQQSLGAQGYADDQASLTSTVQSALGEQLGSTGTTSSSASSSTSSAGAIQDSITNFFGAFSALANDPTDATARAQVIQDGTSLANTLGAAYQRVQQTQSDVATDASSIASQVNQLSSTIGSLNQQIREVETESGSTANELRDTRSNDISQLSQLVNVTTSVQSNGMVNVALADNSSVSLVNGIHGGGSGTTQSLSVTYDPTAAVPLTVSGSSTGTLGTGVPSGGSLGSHLETANNLIGSPGADGDTGILGKMDDVASALISLVNTQHETGKDANGTAGVAFFTGTGAASMAVNSSLVNNPSLIAASSGGVLDGSNAQAISQLQNNSSVLPAFQKMVSNLGTTVSNAATAQSTQDQVTGQLQTQQNSVEGVSLDEEMTNLISFQQAYDASARFISSISSMYDTLINKTGS